LEQETLGFTPQSFSNGASAPEYNIHGVTGVDRVHALGIFGKGAKVGVIDTGVDYTHPAVCASFPGSWMNGLVANTSSAGRLFWPGMQNRWWLRLYR